MRLVSPANVGGIQGALDSIRDLMEGGDTWLLICSHAGFEN